MIQEINSFLANSGNIYLTVAVIGSVIFLIQMVLTVTGLGHHDMDMDVSTDATVGHEGLDAAHGWDGLHLFTFRGIVAFLTFFGWAGYFWGSLGWIGLFIALFAGALMMVITAFLVLGILKLQESGNIKMESLVGCKGVVYLTIPGDKKGKGQVTVSLPKCTRTINAVSSTELKTGVPVKITEIIDNDLFVVEAL